MSKTQDILEFDDFRLDPAEARLTRGGEVVPLAPKVFDLLLYLASNAGRLIEKDELLRALWPDSFVEEANLTVNVAALRRALGSQADGKAWIETIPKRGYRFLGAVKRTTTAGPEPEAPPAAVAAVAQPKRAFRWKAAAVTAAVLAAGIAGFVYRQSAKRTASGDRQQSIAVLPFQELSSGEESAHLGLALADALVNRLATLRELRVMPIATVRKFDTPNVDALKAGRDLGAETVVTGSVQRLDKRLRMNVQLLRVQDGQTLWADKFDEFFTNLFAVQDTISEKLAHTLALRLTSEEQDRLSRRYTENTEAFRLYELGRYERGISPIRASNYFEQSVREDPRYALPYIELADLHIALSGNSARAFQFHAPLARSAAQKAVKFAPDLADAHAARSAVTRMLDRDLAGARRELDIALRLNPFSARVHDTNGTLLAISGDLSSAVDEHLRAITLDPFNGEFTGNYTWALYLNHHCQQAFETIAEYEAREPRYHDVFVRVPCYIQMSRYEDAIQVLETAAKAPNAGPPILATLAHAYAVAGRKDKAREILGRIPAEAEPYERAEVALALGDRDAAIAHLNDALEQHSVWVEWLKVAPAMQPLRDDPRFQQILSRAGLR